MPYNVLSKKYIGKVVISTLIVTSSIGLGGMNQEHITYAVGSSASPTIQVQTVPTLSNGFNGEATKLIIKSDTAFTSQDQFTVRLPSGVTWNDSYTTDGTVTGAAYQRLSDNELKFTVTGSPNEIIISLNVKIDSVNNGELRVVVESMPGSSIPNGMATFANVSGTAPLPTIQVQTVLTTSNGFNGEATKLVIRKGKNSFKEGDEFTVTLPSGVTWNNSYTTDGIVTNAMYHRLNDNSVQFTVTSNPDYITIPLNVKIDGVSNGALNVTVDAPASSSVPSGSVTFANVVGDTGEGTSPLRGIFVLAVPMLNSSFNGEATKLIIKSDDVFTSQDQFIVSLPLGVTWNDSYTTDGTVTNATYHWMNDRSIQFTVTSNPNQIIIPLNIKFDSVSNGALNLTVDAAGAGSIPSGMATFANVRGATPEPPLETSTSPTVSSITITNNPMGNADIVTVDSLTSGDVVKVYDTATNGNLLGTATVANGQTSATISITQLGTGAGKVYVTSTSTGKTESPRTEKVYDGEPPVQLTAPKVNGVTVTDRVITGTAQVGTIITVKAGESVIGTVPVGTDGKFSVAIEPQIEGTILSVTATDSLGSVSEVSNVTVIKDECFIATASYGSKFEPSVIVLREFRDKYLMTNKYGQAFVRFYYRHSPPVAINIASSEVKKAFVRLMLRPFVCVAQVMLKED